MKSSVSLPIISDTTTLKVKSKTQFLKYRALFPVVLFAIEFLEFFWWFIVLSLFSKI